MTTNLSAALRKVPREAWVGLGIAAVAVTGVVAVRRGWLSLPAAITPTVLLAPPQALRAAALAYLPDPDSVLGYGPAESPEVWHSIVDCCYSEGYGTTCGVFAAACAEQAGWPAELIDRPAPGGSGFEVGAHISKMISGARSLGWLISTGASPVASHALGPDDSGAAPAAPLEQDTHEGDLGSSVGGPAARTRRYLFDQRDPSGRWEPIFQHLRRHPWVLSVEAAGRHAVQGVEVTVAASTKPSTVAAFIPAEINGVPVRVRRRLRDRSRSSGGMLVRGALDVGAADGPLLHPGDYVMTLRAGATYNGQPVDGAHATIILSVSDRGDGSYDVETADGGQTDGSGRQCAKRNMRILSGTNLTLKSGPATVADIVRAP